VQKAKFLDFYKNTVHQPNKDAAFLLNEIYDY
jgi:hypothetical protein